MDVKPNPSPPSPAPRILRHPWPPAEAARHEEALRAALREGALMTYPTETAYALGGNALCAPLVEAVFRLKGRPREKSLLLLVDGAAETDALSDWAREVHPAARALMERFWPGALTLVFRAGPRLPPHLVDERGTVALRWSPHPLVALLLRLGGAPLIGTSANPSGGPNPRTLAEVLAALPPGIALALDGGEIPAGPPSTLLDTTVLPFRILRAGAVPGALLAEVLREAYPGAVPRPGASHPPSAAP
jgi:L-threonylcarbamoyladenylate synthase